MTSSLWAIDLSQGLIYVVPVPQGGAPKIDGDLSDWDLSGAEAIWISPQTARQMHANIALMYDQEFLYIGAQVSLPDRPLTNVANPVDAFWGGDLLQVRFAADPKLPYLLNTGVDSDAVVHLSLWKNTQTGKDYMHLGYGVKLDKGFVVNPKDSEAVIKVDGTRSYVIEARVPWVALHAPGGKNPFGPGQKAAFVVDMLWQGGDNTRTPAVYRENPGTFAFLNAHTWGQMQFDAEGHRAPRHPTMEQVLAELAAASGRVAVGLPFDVEVPEDGLKVSVNILMPDGQVLRELTGGQKHAKGRLTLHWDGKDQWGTPMPPGEYKWGAYFHRGLEAQYVGGAGKSGEPYYETPDGKGGWGADHSNPLAVAADHEALYFLWPIAEMGKAMVKTDYDGKVIWRKTPFVGGGFGPFYAVASNGRYVFLSYGGDNPNLVRLDARTGQTLAWSDDLQTPTMVSISRTSCAKVPSSSTPLGDATEVYGPTLAGQPETVGIAASETEVFASVYSQNLIQVMSPETGKPIRTLPCPGPRGLAMTAAGDLYAVSYVQGQPRIVRYAKAQGDAQVLVTEGLEAPWGVAVTANGYLFVSDNGASQQIKRFAPAGKADGSWGKAGGRAWVGAYDPNSFLHPAGVAADAQGGILVAESSIPRVISRWDAATAKNLGRWFGAPQYWNGTWPDPEDPRVVYYQLSEGFARAAIPNEGGNGYPSAYWSLPAAGMAHVGNFTAIIPEIVIAKNGKRYLVGDSWVNLRPRGICMVQGDQMLPVAAVTIWNSYEQDNPQKRTYLRFWADRNGDHQEQPEEVTILDTVEGKPLVDLAGWFACVSMTMTPAGDLYLMTAANCILRIPAAGFNNDGSIRWDLAKASYVVPCILPSMGRSMYSGARGQAGVRVDSQGNVYTVFSANVPAVNAELTKRMAADFPEMPQWQWGAYASSALAARMREGMGHTAESNAVKFAKYSPAGKCLWIAGRKAVAGADPGEMYHHWALSGIVNDQYVASSSEWGTVSFYTQDGFFVDTIMNDPGTNPPPGPYTFGGETGGARVQYFAQRDEVWAYELGMAYQIKGFKGGKVEGERRATGTVTLDRVYEEPQVADKAAAAPLQIVAINGSPMTDASVWAAIPISRVQRNSSELAKVQIAYDATNLYARIHVSDETPLQNGSDAVVTAFKGGDTAGIVLGSAPMHDRPMVGDVRLMAAMLNGKPTLIAMKSFARQAKHPEDYFTPSAGHVSFEFVAPVPDGRVILTADPDGKGYVATFAVPRSFLELEFKPGGAMTGDVEVRLSGQGQRGLQTTSRNYLFTPLCSETTMTDDIPTEARMYPQYWGPVEVK